MPLGGMGRTERLHNYPALEAPDTGHQPRGGISPRTERLHNYPALQAPDTGHYIYYPCGKLSMVGSSLPSRCIFLHKNYNLFLIFANKSA